MFLPVLGAVVPVGLLVVLPRDVEAVETTSIRVAGSPDELLAVPAGTGTTGVGRPASSVVCAHSASVLEYSVVRASTAGSTVVARRIH